MGASKNAGFKGNGLRNMTDDMYLGLFLLVPSSMILIIYSIEAPKRGWPIGTFFVQGTASLMGYAGLIGAVAFPVVKASHPFLGLVVVGGVSVVPRQLLKRAPFFSLHHISVSTLG